MGRLAFLAFLAWAAAGAGCAQLLGLDTTSGPAAAADAPPGTVTLRVVRRSIGATVVDAPADLSALPPANWLVADPNDATALVRMPAMLAGSDTWEAAIADGAPPVEFQMGSDYPVTYRRQLALGQRNLEILYALYEHPDPQPLPATPASFTVKMTLTSPYATGDGFYVEAIGSWGYHPFAASELPAPDMGLTMVSAPETYEPYNAGAGFVAWSGRPLDAIASSDTLIGVHYRGNELIEAGVFPAFDESAAPASLSVTMVPVTTAALDVTVHPNAVSQRLTATRPAGGGVVMGWSAVAAPGYATSNNLGPTLDSAGVAAGSDALAITAPYGNPFASRGWMSVFQWLSTNNRSVTLTGGGNPYVATSGGLQDFAMVASGLDLATPSPLPITISINGTALVADNMTIALDLTKTVQISLDQDTSDPATLYQFNVYNLVLDSTSNNWGAYPVYVVQTTAKTATLPDDVFEAGKTYMIRGHAITGGYPALAQGDLTQRQLPYALGYLDGGIFTVTAQ